MVSNGLSAERRFAFLPVNIGAGERTRTADLLVVLPAAGRRGAPRATFSSMPPTRSTWPERVISPVMARSPRTGRSGERGHRRGRHRDPGRRPLWSAPCPTARRRPEWKSQVEPDAVRRWPAVTPARFARTPRMASPRRAVRGNAPEPGIRVASTKTTSPTPDAVPAQPDGDARRQVRPATSPSGWAGAPSLSTTVSGVTSTGASFPSSSSWSPCSTSAGFRVPLPPEYPLRLQRLTAWPGVAVVAPFCAGLALPVPRNFSLDFMQPLRYGGRYGDSESGLAYSTRQPRPPA